MARELACHTKQKCIKRVSSLMNKCKCFLFKYISKHNCDVLCEEVITRNCIMRSLYNLYSPNTIMMIKSKNGEVVSTCSMLHERWEVHTEF